jgi:hypothetical protein
MGPQATSHYSCIAFNGSVESMVGWGVLVVTMTDTNFVVYAYARRSEDQFGRKGTYYYIGKGRPGRPYDRRNRVGAKTPRDLDRIHILHTNLTDSDALHFEIKLIELYGRKDKHPWGILRNLTNGGEGASGLVRSEEYKDNKRIHFDLYHPELGEYKNVTFDYLNKKFPEIFTCRSSLLQVINGVYKSYKGWVLSSNKNLVKKLNTKEKLRNRFNWFHKEHGSFCSLSVGELIEKLPELKLDKSNLYSLTWGKKKIYRGWTIEKSIDDTIVSVRGTRGKTYTWFHQDHGTVTASYSELVKKYPKQNLCLSLLARVVRGGAKQHKGWTLLE